ncbi:copper transporter [Ornithinimicrobium flavum]|uniref:copper transporter n=1 Tax=Ornithinimicrobium flavum TaxID=1288636 RepID=UPI00106FE446|nr:copper transporter [Ornithinimicrobium flavum]
MIDFRYHVVSLVAVFIALAVGIVLGAGPLREGISDTLEGEVEQLRAERSDLRTELGAAQALAGDKDAALGSVADRVVAGTLSGARVAVVVLPEADRNHVARVQDGVEAAGGEVVLALEVSSDLEALEAPEGRGALARELRSGLDIEDRSAPGDEAAPEEVQPGLAPVLAAALLGADAVGQTGAWLATLERLELEGYVDLDWRGEAQGSVLDRRPPDALLVLDGELATDEDDQPTRASVAALQERSSLVERLAEGGAAAVVAGSGAESRALSPGGGVSPLVGVVRDRRDLREETSTVDNLESAAGQLSAVLALAWELEGRSGSYGEGGSVDAAVPAPAPVRIITPPGPDPDQAEITGPVPEPEDAPGTEAVEEDPQPVPAPTSAPDDATATATP